MLKKIFAGHVFRDKSRDTGNLFVATEDTVNASRITVYSVRLDNGEWIMNGSTMIVDVANLVDITGNYLYDGQLCEVRDRTMNKGQYLCRMGRVIDESLFAPIEKDQHVFLDTEFIQNVPNLLDKVSKKATERIRRNTEQLWPLGSKCKNRDGYEGIVVDYTGDEGVLVYHPRSLLTEYNRADLFKPTDVIVSLSLNMTQFREDVAAAATAMTKACTAIKRTKEDRFPLNCTVRSTLSSSATRYRVTGYEHDRIVVQPVNKDYSTDRCRYAYKPIEIERV